MTKAEKAERQTVGKLVALQGNHEGPDQQNRRCSCGHRYRKAPKNLGFTHNGVSFEDIRIHSLGAALLALVSESQESAK